MSSDPFLRLPGWRLWACCSLTPSFLTSIKGAMLCFDPMAITAEDHCCEDLVSFYGAEIPDSRSTRNSRTLNTQWPSLLLFVGNKALEARSWRLSVPLRVGRFRQWRSVMGIWSIRALTSKQIMKGFWVVLERLGDRHVSWSGTNLSGL